MTRKHFIATANIVKTIEDPAIRLIAANDFADMFAKENSRFNRSKFMEACHAE